ncbi:hypothetical protein EJ06DRAFT_579089 [Trichodelitschia bisporula]|uniref:Uncharacterized protein n=1 Tax=Trichodelitschia bisporula TaxID=703511 RepID=A0A6G1I8E8_9PEZI|nr:hypothetical protein EJ06DRAFT_579089 [Trichodelitschia bisporula]
MPAADLRTAPNFRSHKALPRHGPVAASPGAVQPPALPALSPFLANSADRDASLPPTPPSNTRDGEMRSPHKSSGNTPIQVQQQRSPPTPDTTPPASLSQSFQTAREEASSDGDQPSRNRASLDITDDPGLGLEFERDDADITPTASWVDGIPNREWDTNLMRNVTVRRKRDRKHAETPARQANPPSTPTSSSATEIPTGYSPSRWSSRTDRPYDMESDSRRHSAMSTSSTIIEAVVISTPPQRQRTLRHVSKNLSLRSNSSTSSSPVGGVRLGASTFDTSSHAAEFRTKSPSAARVLKHQKDSPSLRSEALGLSRQSGLRAVSLPLDLARSRPVPVPLGLNEKREKRISDSSDSSAGALLPTSPKYSMRHTTHRFHDPTRAATQKALERVMSLPAGEVLDITADAKAGAKRESTASNLDKPLPAVPEQSIIPSIALHTPEPSQPNPNIRASLVSDHPSLELSDRRSIISYSTFRSAAPGTLGEEHAVARHVFAQTSPLSVFSEGVVSEGIVSEATAISIFPHTNRSLLVVQQIASATGSRRHSLTGAVTISTDTSAPAESLRTSLPTIPGTPTQQLQRRVSSPPAFDSPLKHPRTPPEPPALLVPPAINIHPATPNDEVKESPLDAVRPPSRHSSPAPRPTLQRRESLAAKARRYSESLLRPPQHWESTMAGSSYAARRREQDRHGNLHPFWHPQRFWAQVEDDEEVEEEVADEEFARLGGARLPPGGDTSEVDLGRVGSLKRVLQRSGGFLIGNSLGIERVGSLGKKHFVNLPVGRRIIRGGQVVRRRASGSGSLSGAGEGIMANGAARKSGTLDVMADEPRSVGESPSPKQLRKLRKERRESGESRAARVWHAFGVRVEYVGVGGLRKHIREKRRDKRREELRKSIGVPIVFADK